MGAGVEREDGKEGEEGEGGKVAVVEEKKAWVGWQPDGDATVPRRADLQMRREAEQVAESGCLAGSGQEGCALELCYSTPRSAGWVQPVCCSLSTFHSNKNRQSLRASLGMEEDRKGMGGGREEGRWIFFFFQIKRNCQPSNSTP